MLERLTKFFASRWGIILAGAAIGLLAPILQLAGNPPNMGICVACFERDIAGAIGLHRAAVVQYIRPEIIGFVLGASIAALLFREFRARAGSAPMVRFVLGVFAMIGAPSMSSSSLFASSGRKSTCSVTVIVSSISRLSDR